ncbi:MAG TPA: hypothetical protein VIN37_02850 [Candidatus Limnocylindria bacterium]
MIEGEVLAALRDRFTVSGNGGAGRYAFLTHVRTGAAFDQQEIDAVVVCLWPSDSHALLGFEVKCSRSDWLREIRPNTSKSERARRLCDSWTVVAPANAVKIGELPAGWGLLLASSDEGGAVKLRQQVAPAFVYAGAVGEEKKITRSFLVAMLRAAGAVPGMRSGLKRARVPMESPT